MPSLTFKGVSFKRNSAFEINIAEVMSEIEKNPRAAEQYATFFQKISSCYSTNCKIIFSGDSLSNKRFEAAILKNKLAKLFDVVLSNISSEAISVEFEHLFSFKSLVAQVLLTNEKFKEGSPINGFALRESRVESAAEVKLFTDILKKLHLCELDFSRNPLNDRALKAVVEFAKHNPQLQSIRVGDQDTQNTITSDGLKALSDALKDSLSLRDLDIRGCAINTASAKILADFLKENQVPNFLYQSRFVEKDADNLLREARSLAQAPTQSSKALSFEPLVEKQQKHWLDA